MTAVEAWERFAKGRRPRRARNAAGAATWLNWTQYPDHGPDESILGEVRGRSVLELGFGSGDNLAHLATLGAHCVGVDLAPTRARVARTRWGHLPNLDFRTAEATQFLCSTRETFHVVYSILGAVWFTPPATLLPLIHLRLAPSGVLAFSHLPPAEAPPKHSPRVVERWDLSGEEWERELTDAGFTQTHSEVIPAPEKGKPGTLFVRAVSPAALRRL